MDTLAYHAALERLKLTHASRQTAELLGVTIRQAIRYAHGDCPIPPTLALLLTAYLRHGLSASAPLRRRGRSD